MRRATVTVAGLERPSSRGHVHECAGPHRELGELSVAVTHSPRRCVTDARRRAMGSDAHLVIVTDGRGDDADGLLAAGWARIDELEDRWSRFRRAVRYPHSTEARGRG